MEQQPDYKLIWFHMIYNSKDNLENEVTAAKHLVWDSHIILELYDEVFTILNCIYSQMA